MGADSACSALTSMLVPPVYTCVLTRLTYVPRLCRSLVPDEQIAVQHCIASKDAAETLLNVNQYHVARRHGAPVSCQVERNPRGGNHDDVPHNAHLPTRP